MTGLPLAGIRVLDLSSLLPGPLATLMLAEAGADVVKLERPGRGDEMRGYEPTFGDTSANYAVLNRGKRAFAVDLKDLDQRERVLRLGSRADIVVEQFRPGVADRLGIGYAAFEALNPRVVYCSISSYGPEGPYASRAGHDLNFLAESGLLGVVVDRTGSPTLPVSVIADIVGGAYPAVVNMLLALRQADRTGHGTHVQVPMARNLQTLAYGYFATHQASGGWPRPGAELLTGGSPRYHIYQTADGRHVAVAALEQKFWDRLVEVTGLDEEFRDDTENEEAAIDALGAIFASRPTSHWHQVLDGEDVCTAVVATWEEAVESGLVETSGPDRVCVPGDLGKSFATLRSPLSPALRRAASVLPYPCLEPLPTTDLWT